MNRWLGCPEVLFRTDLRNIESKVWAKDWSHYASPALLGLFSTKQPELVFDRNTGAWENLNIPTKCLVCWRKSGFSYIKDTSWKTLKVSCLYWKPKHFIKCLKRVCFEGKSPQILEKCFSCLPFGLWVTGVGNWGSQEGISQDKVGKLAFNYSKLQLPNSTPPTFHLFQVKIQF